jgi:hypothetical protein
MEELIDLIVTDGAPTDVADSIKQLLYAKAAEKVDGARPVVAASMFSNEEIIDDPEEIGDNE